MASDSLASCKDGLRSTRRCHDLIFPLGLDLQKWKIIIFFTITYITSNSIQLCLFRISKRVIVIVYVIVEVIDFVVATKRDAKSVTIPDETGKAR